jgi:hypothetical protein
MPKLTNAQKHELLLDMHHRREEEYNQYLEEKKQ